MKFAVLSGKDFTVLKEFSVNARMGGKRSYLRIADLNGDGVKDFVYACSSGGGAQGLKSYLRAVSGADGATIWEILGSYLPFGMQSTVKSQGKEIDSGREVQFQGPLVAIPDLDGDGMEEIVTAVMTDGTYSHKALAIFSGKTGKLIATLRPSPSQGSLASGIVQITVLEKVAKGQIGVAAAGTNPRGEAMLVVFFLTKPI